MGLFVDIPKPKAWPPPPEGSSRATELMEYGAKRDPIGDKFHVAFACLFMFALPIDTYPTTIATWILFIYSVLRLPSTWRTITPIYNATIFRFAFAWAAWSLLSIIWSSNQAAGLDHAGALRMVLLPVVLWPVMRQWKYLLMAFLVGVLLQNLAQITEFVWSWFSSEQAISHSLTGIEKHSGKSALFMGFASLAWLCILVVGTTRKKVVTICFLLATAGMFATVSMAVYVGYVCAIAAIGIIALVHRKIRLRQGLILVAVVFCVAAASWLAAGDSMVSKTRSAVQGVSSFCKGDLQANNSTILRLHWWSKTLDEYANSSTQCIFGHGIGSVSSIDFSKNATFPKRADHIHNSYIQILYGEGIIGLTLFIGFLIMLSKGALLLSKRYGWMIGATCLGGVVLWSVATFFENSHSSGRPFAMVILLGTLIMYFQANNSRTAQA